MITFNYETDFILEEEIVIEKWLNAVILSHNCEEGDVNIIFCDFVLSSTIIFSSFNLN